MRQATTFAQRHLRMLFSVAMVALCALLGIVSFVAQAQHSPMTATTAALIVPSPVPIATYGARGDQRDIDTYPAIAYAPASQRFLLVWLTLRNAATPNDGFDVYGQLLDQTGQPSGGQFRISDTNTVARSNWPAVASDGTNFVVAWTEKGSSCRLAVQLVTDSSTQPDRRLELGLSAHQHSPQLLYNSAIGQYVLAFVAGDDYLPPVLANATVADVANCGNNPSSSSEVRSATFHFESGLPKIEKQIAVSQVQKGAFRPTIALTPGQSGYVLAWEDRRDSSTLPYRFDLYTQRLAADFTLLNDNLALVTGITYENGDNSATWTPRPSASGGADGILVTWFEHTSTSSSELWTIMGSLVTTTQVKEKFEIMRMSFGQPHPNDAPTGFLTSAFDQNNQEFAIGVTSHTESFLGYLPLFRLQRLTADGQLLRLDGSSRPVPGIGDRLDSSIIGQLSLAMVGYPVGTRSGYLIGYGKNAVNNHERDYDLWRSSPEFQTQTPTPTVTSSATPTPTDTNTPMPTLTVQATLTPTFTPSPNATSEVQLYRQNLPFVAR